MCKKVEVQDLDLVWKYVLDNGVTLERVKEILALILVVLVIIAVVLTVGLVIFSLSLFP